MLVFLPKKKGSAKSEIKALLLLNVYIIQPADKSESYAAATAMLHTHTHPRRCQGPSRNRMSAPRCHCDQRQRPLFVLTGGLSHRRKKGAAWKASLATVRQASTSYQSRLTFSSRDFLQSESTTCYYGNNVLWLRLIAPRVVIHATVIGLY